MEDETMLAKAMELHFKKHDFETKLCGDGDSAIEELMTENYDVILLDLILPGKDGYAVLEAMKQTINADVPIFVLTNLSQEESLSRAEALGAIRCYVKAKISLKEVIDEIREELAKRSK
ncbi:MAG: winged helix family two component transcriptional regulator [Candidatus Peribacteria bacterium]|nr:winged helix family two component transcriptional regulator [Candidatus Peribacteria bacterium]